MSLAHRWDGARRPQELVVPETAKAMMWCGEHLCVGFKKQYNLIDIRYAFPGVGLCARELNLTK
jgi:hypothetical protein